MRKGISLSSKKYCKNRKNENVTLFKAIEKNAK